MPTLRRILKYMPAVVLGLLVAAWVVSGFVVFKSTWRTADARTDYVFCVMSGSLSFTQDWYTPALNLGPPPKLVEVKPLGSVPPRELLGAVAWRRVRPDPIVPDSFYFRLPIHTLIVVLAPLAVGSCSSFRFRLWHYLAFTALVAVELAYYLRWQG